MFLQEDAHPSQHPSPRPLSPANVQHLIEASFDGLSPELQRAARWVSRQSASLALQSMRHSAREAGVSPATMTRLAQRLGFEGFEELRAPFRQALVFGSATPVAAGQPTSPPGELDLARQIQSLSRLHQANVASAVALNEAPALHAAAQTLVAAQDVFFLGLRACHGVAFYMAYAYGLLFGNGRLVDGTGGTLSDQMADIGPTGVLVALSQSPYTRQTVESVILARRHGADVVALTDSPLSPLTRSAQHVLRYDINSNSHIHSGTGAQALAETLITAAAALGGAKVEQHMRRMQARLHDSGAYWGRPEVQE